MDPVDSVSLNKMSNCYGVTLQTTVLPPPYLRHDVEEVTMDRLELIKSLIPSGQRTETAAFALGNLKY